MTTHTAINYCNTYNYLITAIDKYRVIPINRRIEDISKLLINVLMETEWRTQTNENQFYF